MAKQTQKPKAKELNEQCRKCGSKEFNIAEGPSQNRYCGGEGCNNVWGPMTEDRMEVVAVLRDNEKLKGEIAWLKERVRELEGHLNPPPHSEEVDPKQTDMFK